jgi:hypothetical protein
MDMNRKMGRYAWAKSPVTIGKFHGITPCGGNCWLFGLMRFVTRQANF